MISIKLMKYGITLIIFSMFISIWFNSKIYEVSGNVINLINNLGFIIVICTGLILMKLIKTEEIIVHEFQFLTMQLQEDPEETDYNKLIKKMLPKIAVTIKQELEK